MRTQTTLAACLTLLLPTLAASQTDTDPSVTVQCPARDAGVPVQATGSVSSSDASDVVNYTVEIPPKTQYNTGLWSLKAQYKCNPASTGTRFSSSTFNATGCLTNNKQLFDMTLNPNSTRTGKITIQSGSTSYTVTLYCGIYRAN